MASTTQGGDIEFKHPMNENQKPKRRARKKRLNKPPKTPLIDHEQFLKTARFGRFLQLPAELGNQIYGYVLSRHTHMLYGYSEAWNKTEAYFIPRAVTLTKHSLALLEVCRQIHLETRLLPYTTCTFSLDGPRRLLRWGSRLSEDQRLAVTSLQLRYGPSETILICSNNWIWDFQPCFGREFVEREPSDYDALRQFRNLARIEIKTKRRSSRRSSVALDKDHQKSHDLYRSMRAEYPSVQVSVELVKVDSSEIVNTRPWRPIAEKRILYLSSEDGMEAPLDDMEPR